MSSFESMSPTISPDYWSLHGGNVNPDNCTIIFENYNDCSGSNVMSQRNYPCDNLIELYFGSINLSEIGENAFRHQLYLCMISQTLWMKGEIEMQRNLNVYGQLIWQLNEIWPTGGWGLVEYGSHAGEYGQVLGGRWKPLMYLLKRSLYRDVIATCGAEGQCYCRNDGSKVLATILVDRFNLISGVVDQVLKKRIWIKRGEIGT